MHVRETGGAEVSKVGIVLIGREAFQAESAAGAGYHEEIIAR